MVLSRLFNWVSHKVHWILSEFLYYIVYYSPFKFIRKFVIKQLLKSWITQLEYEGHIKFPEVSDLLNSKDIDHWTEEVFDTFVRRARHWRPSRRVMHPKDPDCGLDMVSLVIKNNYPIESHYVVTEDDYILTL